MSTTTKQFQLSHKLSKQLQREADALHVELEDYITDILLDRHKLQIINQTKKVETLIEKVETLISNNNLNHCQTHNHCLDYYISVFTTF